MLKADFFILIVILVCLFRKKKFSSAYINVCNINLYNFVAVRKYIYARNCVSNSIPIN